MERRGHFALLVALALSLLPALAHAQSDYGQRLQGANGWLLPVATKILGSDEHKHLGRGSVNAWDLVAPNGSAIYAMTAGVVEYAGCGNQGGYGCWVLLSHEGGYTSAYGHMINGSIRVQRGQQVDANTLLGQVGWTGMTSFGPHTHFEIRHGGRFQPIRNFFDISAMKQCNLCSVGGEPVAAQGVAQTATAATRGFVAPNSTYLIILGFFVVLSLLYVFAGQVAWVRHSLYHGMALYVSVVTLVLVVGVPTNAAQPSAAIGGDTWEIAYKQAAKWEGARCVHDPSRTMRGVTQGTYNAYRQSKGFPIMDVCSITETEAKAIYYERYWLASGANALPAALAITHYDMAVNAGVGAAKSILAQCGSNVRCYNNARESFYRSARGFSLYGRGWLNRLADMRSITER